MLIDEYKTLKIPSTEVVFKDRSSKFLGYAYPISTEKEVAIIISKLKTNHQKARHFCYAWRIGVEKVMHRTNDDGEPNNSAGQPIYGQILSFELTNVLIIVVRYFGGTKLGVGGLIHAYRTSAKLALENSVIEKRFIEERFLLYFEYAHMNKVMRLIKEKKIKIIHQEMQLNCQLEIFVRKKDSENIKNSILDLRCVQLKVLN
jgi:uncharacterized YigZ family protein